MDLKDIVKDVSAALQDKDTRNLSVWQVADGIRKWSSNFTGGKI